MEKIDKYVRIFLGVLFTVFGANGLIAIFAGKGFIPMPPPPEDMMRIMGNLFAIGYIMPIVKGVQLTSGLLLLSNRATGLALVMLAPILVNIMMIHIVADLKGILFGLLATLAWAVLVKNRWSQLKILLS